MQTNTLAHAKVLKTNKGLFRLIVGFTYDTLTQRNASFISSDYNNEEDVVRAFAQAAEQLRTNNIVMQEK